MKCGAPFYLPLPPPHQLTCELSQVDHSYLNFQDLILPQQLMLALVNAGALCDVLHPLGPHCLLSILCLGQSLA